MFYDKTPTGYTLRIRVTPHSSRCATGDIFIDNNQLSYLKVNLTAVPENGKANQELIKYLSKLLRINKTSFEIVSGETDRYKKIQINTEPNIEIEEKLNSLEPQNVNTNN